MSARWLALWIAYGSLILVIFGLSRTPLTLVVGFIYILPSMIAQVRGLHGKPALTVVVINLLTSWLIVTWLIALIVACITPAPAQDRHFGAALG